MRSTPPASGAVRQTLLLSVDFEDWHQLVRRRIGTPEWEIAGPALARQMDALLRLLDELSASATFFILGMAARAHPQLVAKIAARGHEIGCHGDCHRPVHSQSRGEFAADLRSARETIERLTGRSPVGYRAPAFSITREAQWAFEVLAEQGFLYDSSQHDSPRIRHRPTPATVAPHLLPLGGGRKLWEFPVAVWRTAHARVPVGGASYWAVLPRRLVLHGLREAGSLAGLYLHPHELDPQPLDADLPRNAAISQRLHGALRAAQRNTARRAAAGTLRAIAGSFELIPYGEAHARLAART
ncbi:MAG: polysaccharide deacetylase family protein [Actinomycetota bacterium]|nr:polysaccharide deacetylase family protein [Actinomycetota bacterium]